MKTYWAVWRMCSRGLYKEATMTRPHFMWVISRSGRWILRTEHNGKRLAYHAPAGSDDGLLYIPRDSVAAFVEILMAEMDAKAGVR